MPFDFSSLRDAPAATSAPASGGFDFSALKDLVTDDGQYRIKDGDTVALRNEDGSEEDIRLTAGDNASIDTSETGREVSTVAKNKLHAELNSGRYRLERLGTDAHGRTLGRFVADDGTDLQSRLVAEGFARGASGAYEAETREANSRFLAGELDPELQQSLEQPGLYRPTDKPRGWGETGDFRRGLEQGVDQVVAASGGLMQIAGQAVGSKALEDRGRLVARDYQQYAEEVAPRVQNWRDAIDSPGNFVDFVQGALGQATPSMALAIGTGGAGGLAGRMAIKKIAQKAAEESLRAAGKAGAVAGVAASSIGQEAGSIQNDLDAAGIRSPGTAVLFGTLAGALDALPQARLIDKFFPGVDKKLAKGFVMSVASEAGLQSVLEGGTEGLQTLIERAAVAFHDPNVSLSSPEAIDDYITSALAGAVVGAVPGAVEGAITHKAKPKTPGNEATDGIEVQEGSEDITLETPPGEELFDVPTTDGIEVTEYDPDDPMLRQDVPSENITLETAPDPDTVQFDDEGPSALDQREPEPYTPRGYDTVDLHEGSPLPTDGIEVQEGPGSPDEGEALPTDGIVVEEGSTEFDPGLMDEETQQALSIAQGAGSISTVMKKLATREGAGEALKKLTGAKSVKAAIEAVRNQEAKPRGNDNDGGEGGPPPGGAGASSSAPAAPAPKARGQRVSGASEAKAPLSVEYEHEWYQDDGAAHPGRQDPGAYRVEYSDGTERLIGGHQLSAKERELAGLKNDGPLSEDEVKDQTEFMRSRYGEPDTSEDYYDPVSKQWFRTPWWNKRPGVVFGSSLAKMRRLMAMPDGPEKNDAIYEAFKSAVQAKDAERGTQEAYRILADWIRKAEEEGRPPSEDPYQFARRARIKNRGDDGHNYGDDEDGDVFDQMRQAFEEEGVGAKDFEPEFTNDERLDLEYGERMRKARVDAGYRDITPKKPKRLTLGGKPIPAAKDGSPSTAAKALLRKTRDKYPTAKYVELVEVPGGHVVEMQLDAEERQVWDKNKQEYVPEGEYLKHVMAESDKAVAEQDRKNEEQRAKGKTPGADYNARIINLYRGRRTKRVQLQVLADLGKPLLDGRVTDNAAIGTMLAAYQQLGWNLAPEYTGQKRLKKIATDWLYGQAQQYPGAGVSAQLEAAVAGDPAAIKRALQIRAERALNNSVARIEGLPPKLTVTKVRDSGWQVPDFMRDRNGAVKRENRDKEFASNPEDPITLGRGLNPTGRQPGEPKTRRVEGGTVTDVPDTRAIAQRREEERGERDTAPPADFPSHGAPAEAASRAALAEEAASRSASAHTSNINDTEERVSRRNRSAVNRGLADSARDRQLGDKALGRNPGISSNDFRKQHVDLGSTGANQVVGGFLEKVRDLLGLRDSFVVFTDSTLDNPLLDHPAAAGIRKKVRNSATQGTVWHKKLNDGRVVHFIYLKDPTRLHVLVHELGHVVARTYYDALSPELKKRMRAAAQRKLGEGMTDRDYYEWLADQLVAWMHKGKNAQATNAIEAFFKRVAEALRKLWNLAVRHKELKLSSTYAEFVDAVAEIQNDGLDIYRGKSEASLDLLGRRASKTISRESPLKTQDGKPQQNIEYRYRPDDGDEGINFHPDSAMLRALRKAQVSGYAPAVSELEEAAHNSTRTKRDSSDQKETPQEAKERILREAGIKSTPEPTKPEGNFFRESAVKISFNSKSKGYAWLSNFFDAPFTDGAGKLWKTAEHAYQAMKTVDPAERERVRNAPTAAAAKALGKRVTMRPDWNAKKREIMKKILRAKFEQNPALKKKLVDTGFTELVHDTPWGDKYWGRTNGAGQNEQGKILMELRDEFRDESTPPWEDSGHNFTSPFTKSDAVIDEAVKLAEKFRPQRNSKIGGALSALNVAGHGTVWLADRAFRTIDGRMNSLAKLAAKRSGKPIEETAAWRIKEHFRNTVGTAFSGETFYRARLANVARFSERAHGVIDGLSDEERLSLHTALRTNKPTGNAKLDGRMKLARELMDEIYAYMRNAGLPVGKLSNYWPVIFSQRKLLEPGAKDEFIKHMVEKEEFTEQAAGEFFDSLFDGLSEVYQQQNMPENINARPADQTHVRHREFYRKLKDPAAFERWLEDDTNLILATYIRKAVNAAEYNRRFGSKALVDKRTGQFDERWNPNEGWEKLMAQASAEKLKSDELREIMQMREAYLGRMGMDMPYNLRKMFGGIMLYQNMRLLMFSTLSSFQDVIGPAIRAGHVKHVFRQLSEGVRGEYAKGSGAYQMAKALGMIADSFNDHVLSEGLDNHYTSPFVQKWNEKFFEVTLLKKWTNFTRAAAVKIGVDSLVEYAELARNGGEKAETARKWLEELGLDAGVVERWSAGIGKDLDGALIYGQADLTWEAKDLGKLRAGVTDSQLKDAEQVAKALRRFVDESILRPDASQRPAWASNPKFMLFWHLKSFMYAFTKTILPRIAHNLNGTDVTSMQMASLAAALMLFPMAAAGLEVRELFQYGTEESPYDRMDGAEYAFELLQRAGGLGLMQLAYDYAQAEERGRIGLISALGGPALDQVQRAWTQPYEKTVAQALPFGAQLPWARDYVEQTLRGD